MKFVMGRIKSFKSFVSDSLNEEDVKPAGDVNINDGSDKDLEKEIKKYNHKNKDFCPRCGEHYDDCKCEKTDYWSTHTYHRVPKGEYKKHKSKQEFKKS